jgi:DNA-binding SARP family transcriptional activator
VREKVAADFISCTRAGYHLRPDVLIDLKEFNDMLSLLARRTFLSDDDRAALQRIVAQGYGFRDVPACRWQWFGPIELQIAELASKAAARLASDAFDRCATAELLELAQLISRADPCDEQGREIAIKAHLAAGRRREAIAEFKQYETALRTELGTRPSAHLRELLETA